MARVLIIDDDEMLCEMLSRHISYIGHEVSYALSLNEGVADVNSKEYDVVFLDVNLPDGNGLSMLSQIRKASSEPEVIIITGEGDPDGAELAIRNGAWDYIEKPLSIERITLPLVRALDYRHEKKTKKSPIILKKEGIIGSSPQIENCLALVAQIAASDANVLITGETGTGKELFARAIHANSARHNKKFVIVDCATLPETLIESILLGHEKGAFTGADKSYIGLIKESDGGTLFLDEIGDLPLSMQKSFLRILQERRFRPIGGGKEVTSDFRLVAATNRNIEKMVETGEFRQDLYFRINALTLHLPPLRERVGDIKELAMHFMISICEKFGTETKGFSTEFLDILQKYHWPGNVRELQHVIENVLTVAKFEPILYPRHLPVQLRAYAARMSVKKGSNKKHRTEAQPPMDHKSFATIQEVRESAIAKIEQKYFEDLLEFTDWDIKETCRIAGISRSRLYYFLQKYHITRNPTNQLTNR